MIISTSGFYSTGSSAVFALLEEYGSCTSGKLENWQIRGIDYENILLYTPDGVFDLEDKLLIGNSIHRSDEALRRFHEKMLLLYNNNFFSMGGFKALLGKEFYSAVEDYIENLVQFNVSGHWEYHYGGSRFNLKKMLGSIRRTLMHQQIIGELCKMPYYNKSDSLQYSFVTDKEFYALTKEFISQYFSLIKGDDSRPNLILNHFLLPHNAFRIPRYFDDDFRLIIIDRDPRDVYVMEKHRARSDNSLLPCDNVEDFVSFWRKLRDNVKLVSDDRIINIRFEDLIYDYEKTVALLEEKCNLRPEDHVKKGQIFNLEKSIQNTQLFRLDNKWNDEIAYIEKELPEYIYDFETNIWENKKIPSNRFGIIY